jgi:hypothetical protein
LDGEVLVVSRTRDPEVQYRKTNYRTNQLSRHGTTHSFHA